MQLVKYAFGGLFEGAEGASILLRVLWVMGVRAFCSIVIRRLRWRDVLRNSVRGDRILANGEWTMGNHEVVFI